MVTIVFTEAEGLQAGETKVRHKDVDIGTVEKVSLTPDMGRVLVQARMRRSVADHLTEGVRFWIVRPPRRHWRHLWTIHPRLRRLH